MADTYTPNLNLQKPGYDSQADISVINSNMDKIDAAFADIKTYIDETFLGGEW